jgi:hypothetical protein
MWYMSPEALQRQYAELDVQVGKATDVYSYSILLWEIITETKPLRELLKCEDEEHVSRIVNGFRPPLQSNKDINKDVAPFAPLLEDCWQLHPERRPNFVTIIHDLEELRAKIFLKNYCVTAYEFWLKSYRSSDVAPIEGTEQASNTGQVLTLLDIAAIIADPRGKGRKERIARAEAVLNSIFPNSSKVNLASLPFSQLEAYH